MFQCAILAQEFGTRLHYPTTDNVTFWDSKQAEVVPACRVEPTGSEDVASIIHTLVQTSCRFAIRSGGHTRERDDSNSDGGVTIDLRQIRTADVSTDRSRVRLGTGHTLVSAYSALEPYNLTFLGGRVDTVGVAGFTLGGGLSNLSPKFGLAMDNVFEYEVRRSVHTDYMRNMLNPLPRSFSRTPPSSPLAKLRTLIYTGRSAGAVAITSAS